MRVAIVGSRSFPDLDRVERWVRRLAEKHPDSVVVSGGAKGVDREAERTASDCKLLWASYRPYELAKGRFGVKLVVPVAKGNPFVRATELEGFDFPTYGRAAFARNELIVRDADQVVAFWDGRSAGTKNSIAIAEHLGVPVHVYRA